MPSTRLLTLCSIILLSACTPAFPPQENASHLSSSAASSQASSAMGASLPIVADTGMLQAADDLFIPFNVEKGSTSALFALTKNGVQALSQYNQNLPNGSIALPYILSPNGLLFLAGIGEKGFSIFTREGKDVTDAYPFLENKKFGIAGFYQLDEDHFAYGIHDADAQPGQDSGIHIRRISDQTEQVFPLSKVGLGRLQGLQPMCLSSDGQTLFVHYQGWEGFEYGSVWRIRLSDLQAEPVIAKKDTIFSYNCSDHHDMILGIKTGHDDGPGMGGVPFPPSSLVLFDTKLKTAQTLVSYDDKLIRSAIITPDAKNIVYSVVTRGGPANSLEPFYESGSVTELFRMKIDGTNSHSIGFFDSIAGMSHDGMIILAGRRSYTPYMDSQTYSVVNTMDGHAVPLQVDGRIDPIACNYGQGFDCIYQQ